MNGKLKRKNTAVTARSESILETVRLKRLRLYLTIRWSIKCVGTIAFTRTKCTRRAAVLIFTAFPALEKLILPHVWVTPWRYEEYRVMCGDKRENSNRLFIGEYGGNIYPGTINMWMKKICRSAGLEERTVHSLRHTNITMQIAAGVPIVTVAGRAGHARTSTTTDIYSHFLKTADRSAAQKIEEIFE